MVNFGVLCITDSEDHGDKITTINFRSTVYFHGQKKGISDRNIREVVENEGDFLVYFRKKNGPFIYCGRTNNSQIIRDRQVPVMEEASLDQRLKISLIIDDHLPVEVPRIFNSGCKFKKDLLFHAGLRNINNEQIIPHDGRDIVGVYCCQI